MSLSSGERGGERGGEGGSSVEETGLVEIGGSEVKEVADLVGSIVRSTDSRFSSFSSCWWLVASADSGLSSSLGLSCPWEWTGTSGLLEARDYSEKEISTRNG